MIVIGAGRLHMSIVAVDAEVESRLAQGLDVPGAVVAEQGAVGGAGGVRGARAGRAWIELHAVERIAGGRHGRAGCVLGRGQRREPGDRLG